MITKEDLQKKYENLSNNELMDIIQDKFNYTELAVIVAMEEISKRKITEEDVLKYKDAKIKEVEIFIVKNIIDDLSFLQKNFYFYLWFPFLTSAFRRNLYHDGYMLKFKQASYYSWLGFITCLISSLIQIQFEFSIWLFFALWMAFFVVCFVFDELFNRNVQIKKLQLMFRNTTDEGNNDEEKLV